MFSLLAVGGMEWVPSKHLPSEWSNLFMKSTKTGGALSVQCFCLQVTKWLK